MKTITIPINYYKQYDADINRKYPAKGYSGWEKKSVDLDLDSTAFILMHSWDAKTPKEYPGWHRAVEYIPRSIDIAKNVLPPVLDTIRKSSTNLIHVVSDEFDYYSHLDGYKKTQQLQSIAEPKLESSSIYTNNVYNKLQDFRSDCIFPGKHNQEDVAAGRKKITFLKGTEPLNSEYIVKDSAELLNLCLNKNINHLIYMGFAINCCLTNSPGGMVDMSRNKIICSAIKQCVTAVENKESCEGELAKENALWQLSLYYGFVFDDFDIIKALSK